MDKKVKTLIDKFGEIPTATTEKDTWTVNLDRTRVHYDGGDTIIVDAIKTDLAISLPLTAPLRDFRDAANFVMGDTPVSEQIWLLEREIIKHYPLCEINHGWESHDAPMNSFVSDTNFWIKVSHTGKLFRLDYWGDELDGHYWATSVESAMARIIEMDRFQQQLIRDTAETRYWSGAQN